MRNPLSNAHIVGTGYDSSEYTLKPHKRGDKDYRMSRSSLKEFAECPSRWIKGGGMEDGETTYTIWGSLVDCLLTEPDKFDARFSIKPETYESSDGTEKPWNANSKTCRQWLKEQGRRTPISNQTWREAHRSVDRLREDSTLRPILESSKFQVYITAEYHDKDTGLVVPICGLIDIVPPADRIDDFKTGRTANPRRLPRIIHDFWYDAQGALYLDLYNAATGEKRELFGHIFQESEHPYEIATTDLSVEFINQGRHKYQNALRLYCQCLKSNHWATYNDLARNLYSGRILIEPENWMLEATPTEDPDWMTDKNTA